MGIVIVGTILYGLAISAAAVALLILVCRKMRRQDWGANFTVAFAGCALIASLWIWCVWTTADYEAVSGNTGSSERAGALIPLVFKISLAPGVGACGALALLGLGLGREFATRIRGGRGSG